MCLSQLFSVLNFGFNCVESICPGDATELVLLNQIRELESKWADCSKVESYIDLKKQLE